jgi:CheY-like chemotaxis protein
MVAAERPDVLILDLGASASEAIMRGWCDLVIELQAEAHGGVPQVIVLTDAALKADAATRVEMELLLVPGSTILQKPRDAAVLQDVLQRVVTGPRRPLRLLVVDDDPLVYKFASQILPSAEYALLYAAGGREALAMLAAHPIDAVLLDLRMPDGSGYDLIRELKLRDRPSHHRGRTRAAQLTLRPRALPQDQRRPRSRDASCPPLTHREAGVRRVVVVEDEALVAKYLAYILEHEGGYAVVTTESGDETLALAADRATVVIVIDVSLRDTRLEGRHIDGLELTRRIKAGPATKDVPVVLATAHVMVGDRERFLAESGADAFVRKPFVDPAEVLSIIAALANRRTGLGSN